MNASDLTHPCSRWQGALFLTAGFFFWSFPADALAQGCAMCKTALSGAEDPLAQGIFWSVLLLMTMPFVVVGSIGGWIFYVYRKAQHHHRSPASVFSFDTAYSKKKEDLP